MAEVIKALLAKQAQQPLVCCIHWSSSRALYDCIWGVTSPWQHWASRHTQMLLVLMGTAADTFRSTPAPSLESKGGHWAHVGKYFLCKYSFSALEKSGRALFISEPILGALVDILKLNGSTFHWNVSTAKARQTPVPGGTVWDLS